MTLKEKFETKSSIDTTKEAKVFAKECEVIADEFAIGFAEWVEYSCWKIESDRYLYEDDQFTTKELLEIYKKESNL
jgi:hypothetical protein